MRSQNPKVSDCLLVLLRLVAQRSLILRLVAGKCRRQESSLGQVVDAAKDPEKTTAAHEKPRAHERALRSKQILIRIRGATPHAYPEPNLAMASNL